MFCRLGKGDAKILALPVSWLLWGSKEMCLWKAPSRMGVRGRERMG